MISVRNFIPQNSGSADGGSWKTQVGLQPLLTLHSRCNIRLLSGQQVGLWMGSRKVQETSGPGGLSSSRRVLWSWVGRWKTVSGDTGMGIARPRVGSWKRRRRDGTRRVSDTRKHVPRPCSSHLHRPGWPSRRSVSRRSLGSGIPARSLLLDNQTHRY